MIISLDTNIFIFGLQQVNPFCVDIVRNLDKLTWNILISSMVEKEVVRNMSKHETNIFYQVMRKLDFPIDYDHPPKVSGNQLRSALHSRNMIGIDIGMSVSYRLAP